MTAEITATKVFVPNKDELRKLPLDRQYAELCTLVDTLEYKERHRNGLLDFPKLLQIEGVVQLGIDWENPSLLVGTEFVEVEHVQDQTTRLLGEYIIAMSAVPKAWYKVHNLTKTLSNASNTLGHPHALQDGMFCMQMGSTTVLPAMVDGNYSVALRILMTALRMKPGTIGTSFPFLGAGLADWPVKEQQ